MYTPKHFVNNNTAEIYQFIRSNSFGILVSQQSGKMLATHIPIELSDDGTKLHGHISRANPQWKNFTTQDEVLAIFSGPHAYISSSWYDFENVPTWNYIATHVYGTIRIIEGDELFQSLKHLVDKYEKHSERPMSIESMPREYIEKNMKGIVGFEVLVSTMEATYKLSQNRDQKNYQAVIHQLEKTNHYNATKVAEAMKEIDNKNKL
jgi:transcriptional regulator